MTTWRTRCAWLARCPNEATTTRTARSSWSDRDVEYPDRPDGLWPVCAVHAAGLTDAERERMARILSAIDELSALTSGGWAPSRYVTDETRATVRRVTGLTVREGDRWTPADCDVARVALAESCRTFAPMDY
jgi:hypothetical protein